MFTKNVGRLQHYRRTLCEPRDASARGLPASAGRYEPMVPDSPPPPQQLEADAGPPATEESPSSPTQSQPCRLDILGRGRDDAAAVEEPFQERPLNELEINMLVVSQARSPRLFSFLPFGV